MLTLNCLAVKKQNVYKCADCKYQTPRKSDLKKHLKRHMGVCDYFCSYCERKFFDKYNLERHVNANHTKKQQYSCTMVMYKLFQSFILSFFIFIYISISR